MGKGLSWIATYKLGLGENSDSSNDRELENKDVS